MSAEIELRPCLWCKDATSTATLSQYGGRCFDCYDSWLVEPQKRQAPHGAGPRGWAHALRKREVAGERLSPFLRDAWREALHTTTTTEGDDQ